MKSAKSESERCLAYMSSSTFYFGPFSPPVAFPGMVHVVKYTASIRCFLRDRDETDHVNNIHRTHMNSGFSHLFHGGWVMEQNRQVSHLFRVYVQPRQKGKHVDGLGRLNDMEVSTTKMEGVHRHLPFSHPFATSPPRTNTHTHLTRTL